MNISTLRVLIGFLVAPGAPALILYLVNLTVVDHQEALLLAVVLAVAGYLAAVVLGVPIFFLARKKGVNGLVAFLALGAVIGIACNLLIFGIEALHSMRAFPDHALMLLVNSAKSVVVALICGAISGSTFWFIAVRRRDQLVQLD